MAASSSTCFRLVAVILRQNFECESKALNQAEELVPQWISASQEESNHRIVDRYNQGCVRFTSKIVIGKEVGEHGPILETGSIGRPRKPVSQQIWRTALRSTGVYRRTTNGLVFTAAILWELRSISLVDLRLRDGLRSSQAFSCEPFDDPKGLENLAQALAWVAFPHSDGPARATDGTIFDQPDT